MSPSLRLPPPPAAAGPAFATRTLLGPTMSLLLIGNYLRDGQHSMKRYAELVQSGMAEAGVCTHLWLPPAVVGRLLPVTSRWFKWLAYVDKLLLAPVLLLFVQWRYARVHICDHSNAVYALLVMGRPCTATCHDVIAIQHARGLIAGWPIGFTGRALQRLISAGIRALDKIYCVSAFTQSQLLDLKLVRADRTALAFNAVDPLLTTALNPVASRRTSKGNDAILAGHRYFLHVGSDHARKNRSFIIDLFCRLVQSPAFSDCSLVFVGPDFSSEQRDLLRRHQLFDRVHSIAALSNEDLALTYAGALALLYPSLQEGFGWPVAEAQACGCPVFASALEPMMEVGGSAARYFQPDDPATAADLVASAPLAQMRVEGLLNSQRFTVPHMIKQLLMP